MIKIINHPRNAAPKELIEKPGRIHAAKINMSALIINKNMPRVTIVIGNVRMNKIGLTIAFILPEEKLLSAELNMSLCEFQEPHMMRIQDLKH